MLLIQKQDMLHTHGSVFYSIYMSRKEVRVGGKEEGRKKERKTTTTVVLSYHIVFTQGLLTR